MLLKFFALLGLSGIVGAALAIVALLTRRRRGRKIDGGSVSDAWRDEHAGQGDH